MGGRVILLTLALAITRTSIAATPEAAAIGAVSAAPGRTVAVTRVNRSGSYATVLVRGALMENSPVEQPVLVRHFSFGWQPLALLSDRCDLEEFHLGTDVNAELMRNMPAMHDREAGKRCIGYMRDSGSKHEIEAIRRLLKGPLVPSVTISGDYALGQWYGAGGGETIFRRDHYGWTRVTGGGGAYSAAELHARGVPMANACALLPYPGDPACKKRSLITLGSSA
jgi:hypothetical protein